MRGHVKLPDVGESSDYVDLAAEAGSKVNDANRKGDRYAACVDRVIANFARGGVQ